MYCLQTDYSMFHPCNDSTVQLSVQTNKHNIMLQFHCLAAKIVLELKSNKINIWFIQYKSNTLDKTIKKVQQKIQHSKQ